MKALLTILVLALVLVTGAAAGGHQEPVIEPGNPSSFCDASNLGRSAWFDGPVYGYRVYTCARTYNTPWTTVVGRCGGCTNDAFWFTPGDAGPYGTVGWAPW